MATFQVTGPDGKKYKVQAPEGATQDQILAKIQESIESDRAEFSFREMVGNIPESAANLVGDIVQPILNPIDTATNVYKLLQGVAQKSFIPGVQDEEIYADAVVEHIKNRYGSWDNAKETIEDDPVGFLSDVSGLIGGAGLIPKTGKLGQIMQQVGTAIDPINLTANTASYTAGRLIPQSLPESMYESAAKFRTAIPEAQRNQMVRTALDEQLMPTSKGLGMADLRINQLGKSIDDLIQNSTETGVSIPKSRIYQNLKQVRQDLGGAKVNAPNDLRKINQLIKQFDVYMKQIGKDSLTPAELQAFKQDVYQRINWNRSAMVPGSYAKETAMKSMGRAAKEELEKINPELQALNQRQGRLLELRPELERAASRIENRDIMGIGMPIKSAAGQAAGGPLGAAIMTGQAISDIPQVKSKMALLAERLRTQGPEVYSSSSYPLMMIRQGLTQAGRIEDAYSQDPIIRALRLEAARY